MIMTDRDSASSCRNSNFQNSNSPVHVRVNFGQLNVTQISMFCALYADLYLERCERLNVPALAVCARAALRCDAMRWADVRRWLVAREEGNLNAIASAE